MDGTVRVKKGNILYLQIWWNKTVGKKAVPLRGSQEKPRKPGFHENNVLTETLAHMFEDAGDTDQKADSRWSNGGSGGVWEV